MNNKFKVSDIISKNSSIFIATFSRYEKGKRLPVNGMIDPLLSFFLPKVKTLLLLDQPHPVSDTINPIVEVYDSGKLKKKFVFSSLFYLPIFLFCKFPSKKRTRISYKLRDLFSVVFTGFSQGKKYDLFIGLEAINLIGGLFLKKIGIIKNVVYYVSDYSPTRFGKTLFNYLYLWLDRYCVKHADFTWDVSPAMKNGRIEGGLLPKDTNKIIHTPNGLFPSQIASLPISQRSSNVLVYMGGLYPEFGSDLAIESLIEVKKIVPDVVLRVIGGGENLQRVKDLVKKLNLEKSVIFYGFVEDNAKMAEIVRTSYIGLAPYREFDKRSKWYGWYGDAGKIRQYIASGLPVVTTHVPPLGKYVTEKGAAIMAKDAVGDFSRAIIKLIQDKKLYTRLTAKAEEISEDNIWENTYSKALRDMEKMNNA